MKEVLHSKPVRKVVTGLAVSIATLAFAGCGDSSKTDKGTNKIGKCPSDYILSGDRAVGSRQEFRAELGNAVVQLSALLPRNGVNNALVVIEGNIPPAQERAMTAAADVFYVNSDNLPYFETEDSQTKVNDLSEEFCTQDGRTYASPTVTNAIGAMQAAGVHIGAELAATR